MGESRIKLRKIVWIGIGGAASFMLLLVGYIYFFAFEKPAEPDNWADAERYAWNKIKFDAEAQVVSADGSDYFLFAKKGESDQLIIYFSGGGVAWDAETAARPISLANLVKSGGEIKYYFESIPFFKPGTLGGILDSNHADNPFKDWNIVYIPYSTGDLHIGNAVKEYADKDGKPFTMRYNGKTNTLEALDWIESHYGNQSKVLIAGESAGGFGAAFWAPEIAGRYPNARIYQYSDGSYLNTERWPDIIEDEWNTGFTATFGYTISGDLISSVFEANRSRLPDDAILLQSNTIHDELLFDFEKDLNGDGSGDAEYLERWSERMLRSAGHLAETLPGYYYYITDYGRNEKSGRTPHTLSPSNLFYKAEQDGVKLRDWLDDAVNKDEGRSIGQQFLEGMEKQ
ncbi:pectin acetylesterase-family hydrolase [Paenibacillus mendelii]|uniref:Pectin acetylesterase-family hydrolase n=1 Tax=Paenibacillus mendelii TaxID=206163 RepID=A0ABV6J6G3_9BACL|nr:pectin acetylesterase-family hydrolase [Paenibacillus mendelii]MCQ6561155.1 pectinacetylesterase family protein [Paenibacillus mendelii]